MAFGGWGDSQRGAEGGIKHQHATEKQSVNSRMCPIQWDTGPWWANTKAKGVRMGINIWSTGLEGPNFAFYSSAVSKHIKRGINAWGAVMQASNKVWELNLYCTSLLTRSSMWVKSVWPHTHLDINTHTFWQIHKHTYRQTKSSAWGQVCGPPAKQSTINQSDEETGRACHMTLIRQWKQQRMFSMCHISSSLITLIHY